MEPKKRAKKEKPQPGTIVVNNMPVILRPADRTKKDIGDWWFALQVAEQVIFPNRTRLYDLYSTVIIDGHLSGIIEKRIASILNKKIYFEKDGTKVDELDKLVDGPVFRKMVRQLMLQKFWGLSGMEFVPGPEFDFNIIPRKHIKPESCLITKEQQDQTGFGYEDIWNIWVIGDRNDFGILLKCAPYVIWKKGNMGDWAQYIEIFGQPVIVTKYDAHDVKTRTELDEMMRNAGSSLRLQIPNQANFEIVDGKSQSNGNGDLQDKFRQACNEEMSVIVLGATETTVSSGSSGYAQSKIHGKQQQEILKADMIDISDLINTPHFINIVKSYGFPVDESGKFSFEQEVDLTEQQTKLNIALSVAKTTPVDDDYIYELTGIPKPANYDALKAEKEAQRQEISGDPDDDNPDDDNPDPEDSKKDKKKKKSKKPDDLNAALNELSFWQKLKALFTEAP